MRKRGRPPHPGTLTPRESEVLALLRLDLTNEQIAERLSISLDGAKYHVSEILSKLSVSSREEAAAWQPPVEKALWRQAIALPLVAKAAGLTFAAAAIAGLIVLALGVARTSTSDDAAATAAGAPEFNITVANGTPKVPSDLTFEVNLADGDVNFASVVRFVPGDWGILHGDEIPVGAEVGNVHADVTVGLIGSPCNQVLPVEFTMLNATLDQTNSIDFGAEEEGHPLIYDWAEDSDGNGIIEAVDRWPEFIFRTLKNTEEEPIRRSAGMIILASIPVLLQFVTFPPGTFILDSIPDDPALGYPTVVLLQNLGDPQIDPVPGPITDFCTPLASVATFFGVTKDNTDTADVDESGVTLLVNPLDGTYEFTLASTGQRDADGDGYENSLDTCPLDPTLAIPEPTTTATSISTASTPPATLKTTRPRAVQTQTRTPTATSTATTTARLSATVRPRPTRPMRTKTE